MRIVERLPLQIYVPWQWVNIRSKAEVVSVKLINEVIYLYAIVDTENPYVKTCFYVLNNEEGLTPRIGVNEYIGTVIAIGNIEKHVFIGDQLYYGEISGSVS